MDITEVENIRDNILWLEKRIPNFINNWKFSRPNCEYQTGLIKEICYNPQSLSPTVFEPLIKWLFDYELNREGKLQFQQLDNFLKAGLYRIYRFVMVSEFISQNPQFYAPSPDPSQFSAYAKSKKTQNEFSDFVDTLTSKLIGCNKQLNFLFIDLSKTIKDLPEDLKKVKNYLENQCVSLKLKDLRK